MTGISTVFSVSPLQYNTGTASQSGTTVTGVGTTWTSAMVGSQFIYANGLSSGTITAVGSATSLTVTVSQTVASQSYTINYTGLQLTSAGNVGIGNLSPAALLDIGNSGAMLGTVRLEGSASGYVQLQPTAAAGSWTMTLPSSPGTSGNVLQTDGTGLTSWVAPSASGGLSWQSVQTSAFTAVIGNGYPINTTSAAITVTLPASPSTGSQVGLVDYAGTFGTNNLTISPNGLNINGKPYNFIMNAPRGAVVLTYMDTTQGWVVTAAAYAAPPITGQYTATYLVVAGGGGGGVGNGGGYGGGGGGGGGYLTGTYSLTGGTVYTVIIGAGGTSGSSAGSNSSISSIATALGGGLGAPGGNATTGGAGGSGGGGGAYTTGTAGGAGTSGQGYAGGTGASGSYGAAGGGGASAIGSSSSSNNGGNGGAGALFASNSTTYAGGGGGGTGSGTAGSGGAGGGGAGGATSTGTSGTVNTGGGAGGGGHSPASGNGGSGVVFLVVPTAYYSGITTGSPTITTSGSNTLIKFTSSGSYTA